MPPGIVLRTGTVAEAVAVSDLVPEFNQPHRATEYHKRLQGVPHLVLVAEAADGPVAFKVGYERDADGTFYSWMGGVAPQYRRLGLAQLLAERQEAWAKAEGYRAIRFKTLNRHQAMLLFAIGRGFHIVEVLPRANSAEHRIVLEKPLTKA